MVGGAINQQPHASQLAPPQLSSSTAPAATTEEDEFLKRNTDCVYFLASPLTCKKGSECEYRHSDIARVNPRDCWYWLNDYCLNPKCGFRHPPLHGLFGAEEVSTPLGPTAPQAPVKQGVTCIFYQKGFCLKGHFCPFLHGPPNIVNNIAVQAVPPNHVTKPSKAAPAGPEKHVQEQKSTQYETVQKPIGPLPPQGKQVPRVQPRNGAATAVEKMVPPPHEEPSRYKPATVTSPPVTHEFPLSRSNHGVYETNDVSDNEGINGKDVEEYSREPTPGFDVLVDNELDDSEYYPNEEQYGRSRSHDFDTGRSIDYDVDREMYPENGDFDHCNRENTSFGRKRYLRDESPNEFEQSDLRHRISKQRGNNVGGLRSVISNEHSRDSHTDRISRDSLHNDRHLDSGPLSSRFRGRIKIPGRSASPGYENGSRVEREIDIRREHRSRYSPGRPPHVSSNHSRYRDGINGRSNDQTLGKRKYPRTESQQSEVTLSFEGPKPLSEILKRKRGSVRSVVSSVNKDDTRFTQNNKDDKQGRREIPSGNMLNADNEKSTNGQSSSLDHEQNDVDNKVGSIDEDAMLDQELEAYDHRDGDYEYEQIDGEDYNLEEYIEDETGQKESEVWS